MRLTELSHGSGCACKIGPADLQEIVGGLPGSTDPNLLVGFETCDDAGVYRVSDELVIVQSVDFFTPIVDDPYDFGRIAATNALSDVYAMGGTPILALAIVGMPIGKLEPETIGCGDGIVFPGGYRYGWEAAQLRLKPLYRCGIRKPRSCKLTIGRDRTYVYDTTDRGVHYTSTVHVKWSVTFLARGR